MPTGGNIRDMDSNTFLAVIAALAGAAVGAYLNYFFNKKMYKREQHRAQRDNHRTAVAAYIRESREVINDYNRRITAIVKDGPRGDFELPSELTNKAGGPLNESQINDLGSEKLLYYHTTIVSLEVLELHLHYPNLRASYWKLRNMVQKEYNDYIDLVESADTYVETLGEVDYDTLVKVVKSPITDAVGNARKEFKELAIKELSLGPPPGYQVPPLVTSPACGQP